MRETCDDKRRPHSMPAELGNRHGGRRRREFNLVVEENEHQQGRGQVLYNGDLGCCSQPVVQSLALG